jgi:hypothetical protein
VNIVRQFALAGVLLGLMAGPAHAQLHVTLPGGAPRGAGGTAGQLPGWAHPTGVVSVFPFAQFNGVSSTTGAAVDGEAIWGNGDKGTYGFGVWYWNAYTGSGDLYEVHGSYNITHQLGIQAGTLGSFQFGGHAIDAFLTGSVDSSIYGPLGTHAWAVQAGVGPFFDLSGGFKTTDVTAFAAGSLGVYRDWSLTASYWYLPDRHVNNTRIVVGASYKL